MSCTIFLLPGGTPISSLWKESEHANALPRCHCFIRWMPLSFPSVLLSLPGFECRHPVSSSGQGCQEPLTLLSLAESWTLSRSLDFSPLTPSSLLFQAYFFSPSLWSPFLSVVIVKVGWGEATALKCQNISADTWKVNILRMLKQCKGCLFP